jgi:hypothetical protein
MNTIQYGSEYWKMHDSGEIERPGLVSPSIKWRILGAVEYTNFGKVKKIYTLDDIKKGGIQWQYKNGHQRVFVRDFDHGTMREWRHPKHSIF